MILFSSLQLSGCAPIIAGTVAGAGATMVKDRRNVENIIEDQVIELRATDAIYSDKIIGRHVRINVISFNGIVLLTGEAPTAEMRAHAGQVAYSMRNVREVYNEVQVKKPISFERRANDTWLTTKVKTKLITNRGLFTRAKVVGSDGNIYLLGLVSPNEAEQMRKMAEAIDGVANVIALFEPIDNSESDVLRSTSQSVRTMNQAKTDPALEPDDGITPDEEELTVMPYTEQPSIQISSDK